MRRHIRQIEAKALPRLKHSSRSRTLDASGRGISQIIQLFQRAFGKIDQDALLRAQTPFPNAFKSPRENKAVSVKNSVR
jgi:hypothetical protein